MTRNKIWDTIPVEIQDPFYQKDPDNGRIVSWTEATREALSFALAGDPSVFIMGEGVDDPYAMFGTTKDLHKEFGSDRVFDTPLAETGITGIAVGAAQAGMHPLYFHNRPDFLYLALDQLANHAAKWAYMFAGQVPIPLVIWSCIGRGWAGSGAQHSQALQGLFTHIPGLKVVMPASCFDVKGLMLAAIKDRNPVVIIDHRYNFKMRGHVPEEAYIVPLGKGVIRRTGKDVTIVATSHLVFDAWQAAEELANKGIDAELIDPRTLKPLDEELILQSIEKTGRLVVVDTGWKSAGFAAEVAALAAEKAFSALKAPIRRVTAPDAPTLAGSTLEEGYYVGKKEILAAVQSIV
ncbi:acetoin catabolism protein AcoB [Spirochaetia bacterium]|nr:acetoin catabolism protein AcoB [Spirochaetia bacterium]